MQNSGNTIRTRAAPSPTGFMHVGNARTFLFEYLFAKSVGGEFHLRIEDTDQKRYVEGAEQVVYDTFNFLGLKWDGEVIKQSSRLSIYKDYARKLVEQGNAYFCFCSEERLSQLREEQEKNHQPTGYDRKCRDLHADEVLEKIKNGESHVIRLKMPETGKIVLSDMIRGEIEFDLSLVDDQVLLKADGFPTYHLAVVVDDHMTGITHVIRGDEWVSSIPKHIYLYQCFGWEPTKYGHLSVILGSDKKKKLSKRDGAVSVEAFRTQGYLVEAIINYIALLGWNPGTEREFFTLAELEKEFNIKRVQKSPAMFDMEKFNHFNAHYIHEMNDVELLKKIKPFSEIDFSKYANEFLQKVISVVKTRMVTLKDFDVYSHFFFTWQPPKKDMIKFAKSDWQNTILGFEKAIEKLENLDDWNTIEKLNEVLLSVVTENGLKNGDVFWPIRASLSAESASPSPTELLWVLGKELSLNRLKKCLVIIK
ncbi:MAG TPA: glutamate--tRNA ligase [Patescibacteria group bacterium]|nr:glutamate--tRNA ligase [Patescibacteria group bacterium]